MFKLISNNEEETKIIARRISGNLKNGTVISLIGEMGAGKTTFTQGLAEGLNIKNYVTSPTFSLVNVYYGDKELNHIDLYRIEEEVEIETIDIDNYYYPDGITVVEWAERAEYYLPKEIIEIIINKIDEDKREFIILGRNALEKNLIERM